MDERKIDFALISSTRAPRGEGKTEKDRAKKSANGNGPKRRQGGKRVNFEADSAFRKEKGPAKPKKAKAETKEKKAKTPSDKTRKIAAATKAKRAAKKQPS